MFRFLAFVTFGIVKILFLITCGAIMFSYISEGSESFARQHRRGVATADILKKGVAYAQQRMPSKQQLAQLGKSMQWKNKF